MERCHAVRTRINGQLVEQQHLSWHCADACLQYEIFVKRQAGIKKAQALQTYFLTYVHRRSRLLSSMIRSRTLAAPTRSVGRNCPPPIMPNLVRFYIKAGQVTWEITGPAIYFVKVLSSSLICSLRNNIAYGSRASAGLREQFRGKTCKLQMKGEKQRGNTLDLAATAQGLRPLSWDDFSGNNWHNWVSKKDSSESSKSLFNQCLFFFDYVWIDHATMKSPTLRKPLRIR